MELPSAFGHALLKRTFGQILYLSWNSLGAIYGDIGTSPLYTVSSMFEAGPPTQQEVLGGISLLIWTLIYLPSIKYCVFIMKAHNKGEGGIFALYSLLVGYHRFPQILRPVVTCLAIFGASFIIGDGAMTPAISILSAIEGLKGFSASLDKFVIPIAVLIMAILFLCQRYGTGRVSCIFAPVTFIWLCTLATMGITSMATYGTAILEALNPYYGICYIFEAKTTTIASVFLAITGLEAMYADLGHFGSTSIRIGWFCMVLPSLLLTYLGQGAYLLQDPSQYNNIFWATSPGFKSGNSGAYIFIFIMSTFATIIASQAMITGSFSLMSHAVSLKVMPNIKVVHTSKKNFGQIYVPSINYVLMCLSIFIIFFFKTSQRLTNAYGVSVCSDMMITTIMYSFVIKFVWEKSKFFMASFLILLLPIDLFFFILNYGKVPLGGWFPLSISAIVITFMWLFLFGERSRNCALQKMDNAKITKIEFSDYLLNFKFQEEKRLVGNLKEMKDLDLFQDLHKYKITDEKEALSPQDVADKTKFFVDNMDPKVQKLLSPLATTIPKIGVYICPENTSIPSTLYNVIKMLGAAPSYVIFLHIKILPEPSVPDSERFKVEKHSDFVYTILAHYGYTQSSGVNVVDWENKSRSIKLKANCEDEDEDELIEEYKKNEQNENEKATEDEENVLNKPLITRPKSNENIEMIEMNRQNDQNIQIHENIESKDNNQILYFFSSEDYLIPKTISKIYWAPYWLYTVIKFLVHSPTDNIIVPCDKVIHIGNLIKLGETLKQEKQD